MKAMHRFKVLKATILASILAVVALSAIATASASAALPEFEPGKAGEKFTGTSGSGTLASPKGTIECTADKVTGETTGTTKKTATATVTFTGCKVFGIIGAHSLGDAEGTILTKVALELCYINKTNKEVGALTEVTSPVHIEVAGKLVEVTGDQVAAVTPVNTKTKTFKLVYKEKSNKGEPAGCEGKTETLKTSENEGTAENSGEATEETTTYEKEQTLKA
jgi:hypothetical protein